MTTVQHLIWVSQRMLRIQFMLAIADRTPGTIAAITILWSEFVRATDAAEHSGEDALTKEMMYRDALNGLVRNLQAVVLPEVIDF